jgi:16S rRNA (uracil1498-N3)-methyltransferase
MPKGDRQRAVIEKAVELGVHELVPLACQRSVSVPTDSSTEKWHRTVVEACKQCERNRLMQIAAPCTFESFIFDGLTDGSPPSGSTLRMFAHPSDHAGDRRNGLVSLYDRLDVGHQNVTIAIGPEGGFTQSEVQSAIQNSWTQLELGSRILRVETAVCVASIYASLCVQSSG